MAFATENYYQSEAVKGTRERRQGSSAASIRRDEGNLRLTQTVEDRFHSSSPSR
jgi:hypothetical protein